MRLPVFCYNIVREFVLQNANCSLHTYATNEVYGIMKQRNTEIIMHFLNTLEMRNKQRFGTTQSNCNGKKTFFFAEMAEFSSTRLGLFKTNNKFQSHRGCQSIQDATVNKW